MTINADLHGADSLAAALSRIAEADGLAEVLQAAAGDVRAAAVAGLADGQPPDTKTGALAASLTVSAGGDGLSFSISTPLDYGWHLEYGSSLRPAMPWLAPALDTAVPSIDGRLREWLDSAVKQATEI